MNKRAFVGWIASVAGSAFWIYGYLVTGHASLIDWHTHTTDWIAKFLPNVESEIGMLFCVGGAVAMYWPTSKRK